MPERDDSGLLRAVAVAQLVDWLLEDADVGRPFREDVVWELARRAGVAEDGQDITVGRRSADRTEVPAVLRGEADVSSP